MHTKETNPRIRDSRVCQMSEISAASPRNAPAATAKFANILAGLMNIAPFYQPTYASA